MKNERYPLTIVEAGVSAKIRRISQTKNGTEYTAYIVEYNLLGKRTREWRSDLGEAKRAAAEACRKIANGEHCALQLKNQDRLVYLRAIELLRPTQTPLDIAASEFAQAVAILNGRGSLMEAAREFASRHSVEKRRITVADAVELLINRVKLDGKSDQRQRRLKSHLDRFAEAFVTDVDVLTPKLVANYLAALPMEERTKANHRDSIGFFSRWLVAEAYLPKNTNLLEGVQRYSKRKYGAVEILTAEEMASLLALAQNDLLPFLALCGFAGLRSIEVQRLDWRDIDFEDNFIEIREETAKQHEGEILRRIVPMTSNLKTWLLKVRKTSGAVCPFNKVENQLKALCKAAGVTWKHNCLRHSAISYRVALTGDIARVADESGNSPYVIRKNYLRRRKMWHATQWFGIEPGQTQTEPSIPTPEEAKAMAQQIMAQSQAHLQVQLLAA